MSAHGQLFQRLQDIAALQALLGKTEDLHLKVLAKAFCGFANADGGVVVIGMEAKRGSSKDDPDVIQQARR